MRTPKHSTIMTTAGDPTSSVETPYRYQQLMAAVERVLDDSKESLDLRQVVHDCYGSDGASIFHDEALLRGLFSNMLEKAHRTVMGRMKSYMEENKLDKALGELERVVAVLERQDADAAEAEAAAKSSAQRATRQAVLPPGVSHSSLVRYHTYHEQVREAQELERQIGEHDREADRLTAERDEITTRLRAQVRHLRQHTGRDLERSADMSTMIS